jgi:electron transfer flavoprotein alpha/beta subunit
MGVGEPRYASLKGIMGAKKKMIAILAVADLALDRPVGRDGAKTELLTIAKPAERGKGQVVVAEDGAAGAKIIFDFLKERKLV